MRSRDTRHETRDTRLETRGRPHLGDSSSRAAPRNPRPLVGRGSRFDPLRSAPALAAGRVPAACGSWICLTPSAQRLRRCHPLPLRVEGSDSGGGIWGRNRVRGLVSRVSDLKSCQLCGLFRSTTIPRWLVLVRARVGRGLGAEESPSLGWRVGVDGEALAVDHDVVVEPAHRRQVLGVGAAAVDPPYDVMHLEAVSAGAARNGACRTVTIKDEAAQLGRDRPGAAPHAQWDTVVGAAGDFDDAVTQDRFDRRSTNPRPGCHPHPGLTIRSCCFVRVDEHGQQRCWVLDRGAVTAMEAVDADRPQSVRIPGCPRHRRRRVVWGTYQLWPRGRR